MKCLTFVVSAINSPNKNHFSYYYTSFFKLGVPKSLNIHFSSNRPHKFSTNYGKLICVSNSISNPQIDGEHEEEKEYVQNLRVPHNWLNPSKALEESEWLRVTLHKWLDDEYCPEETNVEISKIAALSYYESLVEKETDLGEILLKMAVKLEGISYQESFHGAFSSANAAVNLILQRIVED